jgi:hypothetical protein
MRTRCTERFYSEGDLESRTRNSGSEQLFAASQAEIRGKSLEGFIGMDASGDGYDRAVVASSGVDVVRGVPYKADC